MWRKESSEIEIQNNAIVGSNRNCKRIPNLLSNEEFIQKYYRCNNRKKMDSCCLKSRKVSLMGNSSVRRKNNLANVGLMFLQN